MSNNDLNQCNFIGNLGADPETSSMADGTIVSNFSIACGWKTKTKEGTEWIRVAVFGRLAEICDQYLNKGDKVFISGNMRTRKWQDNSGADRYTTEIVARDMQMLGSPQRQAPQQQQAPKQQAAPQQQASQQGYVPRQRGVQLAPQQQAMGGQADAPFDDDIPF